MLDHVVFEQRLLHKICNFGRDTSCPFSVDDSLGSNGKGTRLIPRVQMLARNDMADDILHLSVGPLVASTPYDGIPLSQIRPVFNAACSLRHSNPQPGQIIAATKTTLEARVVSAIIEGARRPIRPGKDPTAEAIRKRV